MWNLLKLGRQFRPDMVQNIITGPKFLTNRRILWLRNLLNSNAAALSVARYVVYAIAKATNGVVKLLGSACSKFLLMEETAS
mmetsp:Transcript_6455/g.7445  ORF Transcript_6455/g.7445 Transcript_6455/m.7445 type:complete len:82 (+) Transcript_6455:3555-3800(+)